MPLPPRTLETYHSFEELERATLHLLDTLTPEERVDYFFAKRREWLLLLGKDPDEMVGKRTLVVKKHWLEDEYLARKHS